MSASPETSYTPRRSVLYMPSSNARALEKAKTIACDGLILDLEDAVAPDAKPSARDAACAAVNDAISGTYAEPNTTTGIKIHSTTGSTPTPWFGAGL